MNFEIEGDDGYKLYIDDSLYIDAWTRNRWGAKQFSLNVKANNKYNIVVEHRQSEGNAAIKLRGGNFVKTDIDALIARHKDGDVFIFAGGISPQLEGEEMKVNFPGFDGGDRTTIMLPNIQTQCMKALQKAANRSFSS